MWDAKLDESQAGIKIVWRIINNFRYASDITLMVESEEELKSFLVWGGRREEGSGWGTHVYLWQIHFDIWQN